MSCARERTEISGFQVVYNWRYGVSDIQDFKNNFKATKNKFEENKKQLLAIKKEFSDNRAKFQKEMEALKENRSRWRELRSGITKDLNRSEIEALSGYTVGIRCEAKIEDRLIGMGLVLLDITAKGKATLSGVANN